MRSQLKCRARCKTATKVKRASELLASFDWFSVLTLKDTVVSNTLIPPDSLPE